MTEFLLMATVVMVGVPVVGYFTIKFGTYAFFRGKRLFEQEEKSDGERKKTEEGEALQFGEEAGGDPQEWVRKDFDQDHV